MKEPWSLGAELERQVKSESDRKIQDLGLEIMRLCNDAKIEAGEIVDVLARVLGTYVGVSSMRAVSEEHKQAIYSIPHALIGLYAKEPNYEKYLTTSTHDEYNRLKRSKGTEL